MGLLDMVLFVFVIKTTGSVVVRSSQGRFFSLLRVLAQKRSYFVFF